MPDADDVASGQIRVPPEEVGGRYANLVAIWHTGHEFTLDFCATQPSPELDAQVVARVRVAPTLVFDVLRALNENMSRYEEKFGPIPRLQQLEPNSDEQES